MSKPAASQLTMQTSFVEFALTCRSWQEAQKITDALLKRQLVAAVEFFPEADRVKLIMQTRTDYFAKIEAVVRRLHSNKLPHLHTTAIAETTDEIRAWLEKETNTA